MATPFPSNDPPRTAQVPDHRFASMAGPLDAEEEELSSPMDPEDEEGWEHNICLVECCRKT